MDDIISIPMKIIKRYLHHFNPLNFINFAKSMNPWPKIKPYWRQIRDLIVGPSWDLNELEGKPMDNGFLRDEFGFKKIIFGITHSHTTIACISTKAGYIEWNINLD